MDAAGIDRLAVCDDGSYLGVVSVDDVIHLDDVIDRTRYGTQHRRLTGDPTRRLRRCTGADQSLTR
jgi:hypothetical protein